MKTIVKSSLGLLALAATFAITTNASGQEEPEDYRQAYGTTAHPDAPDLQAAAAALAPIKPIVVIAKSSYATGGVGLRNRGAGNISVSGLVGAPKLTFIYWAVISIGAPPAPATSINVQRLFPLPVSPVVNLPGVVVGVGPSPCWNPAGAAAVISVYRAVVPMPAVATGNGSYQVTLNPGAGGLINGADPWTAPPVFPLWEGASLVMVGNGVGTVSVYDAGLAGNTFAPNPPFNYTLVLPVAAPGVRTLFDNIGADGQHVLGVSRKASQHQSDETTTVNGFLTAGPGSKYTDSDWNGSSALPVPELWDDTGHDITPATPAGTAALNFVINSALGPADCLTPVANVVEED